MLARSFADIGDIIRGKDLYLGDNGKDRLEENLRKIFGKIHEAVTSTTGKNRQALRDRYNDNGGNYYKLREDWWNNNRKMDKMINIFDNHVLMDKKCRCKTNVVPTYFDYVPQYLRWFEEWAEDFCTKRKHKLQNAIKNCRGPSGTDKYCDLNGYNCEQTIRVDNKLVEGADCKKCTVPCDNFVHWIDNQKKEFEKQKEKYTKEMQKAEKTRQETNGTINNLYVGDFYKNLQENYPKVEEFLKKLNDESICKKPPKEHDDLHDNEIDQRDLKIEDEDEVEEEEVCEIVDGILTGSGNLDEACKQKYDGKYYGWRCVPTTSGDSTATSSSVTATSSSVTATSRTTRAAPGGVPTTGSGNDGAICVPPRRRKLYLHKIEGVDTTDDKSLRKWFIETAAIETFFAWHEFKEHWRLQKQAELQRQQENGGRLATLNGDSEDDKNNPEKLLKVGTIPPDFLRLMFYTLGDYRDILYSGGNDTSDSKSTSNSNDIKNIVLEASGTQEEKEKMRQIQEQLKTFFSNSGDKPSTGTSPGSSSGRATSQTGTHSPSS
ncbi:hypothetical protein PFTANZ_06016, partial [Plasmodium falciparum Tanzania (2000708)]